jgi:hypothetical protein
MFIPRIGYGLKSLTLGGVGYTSSMPLSDNQLNQILGFLPTIEHLKLMKLGIYIINIFNYNIFLYNIIIIIIIRVTFKL